MTQLLHYCYDDLAFVTDRVDGVGVSAGGSVVIGNFDGLHRGHMALLSSLREPSFSDFADRPLPRPWIVLTFEPHPRSFFSANQRPEKRAESPLRLSSVEQKHRLLEDSALEIDSLVVLRFDEGLSKMPAQDFVQDFLVSSLGAKHLVVGEDFAFGRNREGTLTTLREMSTLLSNKDIFFRVHCFPTLSTSSSSPTAYSSTRARELLRLGRLEEVREILGRDFEIEGVVIRGKGLGSELGFPTANIDPQDYCHPLFGVYCVRVLHNGVMHEAVASFGERPTLGAGLQPLLEVHFFDCPNDLYGSKLRVSFEKFQRKEENYASLDALRLQIKEDVKLAKQYFYEEI